MQSDSFDGWGLKARWDGFRDHDASFSSGFTKADGEQAHPMSRLQGTSSIPGGR